MPITADSKRQRGRASSMRRHSDGRRDLTRGSRVLHRLGETVAHVFAGSTAALIALVWIVVGVFSGFPAWWATVLYSVSALTTFVMVFVIQHTQARQTLAMQRKLDEVVRSLRGADNAFVAVEEAPDEDLRALAEIAFRDRDDATRSTGPDPAAHTPGYPATRPSDLTGSTARL